MLIFDTHAAVEDIIEAGMPKPQAEAVIKAQVRFAEQELATKSDLAELKVSLIKWMVGTGLAVAALVIAANKL